MGDPKRIHQFLVGKFMVWGTPIVEVPIRYLVYTRVKIADSFLPKTAASQLLTNEHDLMCSVLTQRVDESY